MKKKTIFYIANLICLICLLLVLSGCWDYTEYENMVQIIAMGVDFNKKSKETTVTIQYLPTTKQKGGSEDSNGSSEKECVVCSATDKTLFGAVSRLREITDKEIFFPYLKVIVVSEEAAIYKTMDLVELLDRIPSIRSSTNLVISSGKAEDTISTFDAAHIAVSGELIYNLSNLSKFTGTSYPVTIHDFTQMLAVPGLEATAPRVLTVYKKSRSEEGITQDKIRFAEKREGVHRVSGIAVFQKDRLVGWLDEKESFGFSMITGKNLRAYKESEIKDEANTEDIFYYRIKNSKSKIKVKMDNDEPVVNIDVTILAELRKYYSYNKSSEIFTSKDVSDMETKLSNIVHSDIEAALEKGQAELKSDIFGFGFALFRGYPKLWKMKYEQKWDDIFPDIAINVSVNVIVKNTSTNNRKLIVK
jgi:spore germination protein KC